MKKSLTALSGKVFAVVLTPAVNPALPPAPVIKLQDTRTQKPNNEIVAAMESDTGTPASK
jgi:hypothetical protein